MMTVALCVPGAVIMMPLSGRGRGRPHCLGLYVPGNVPGHPGQETATPWQALGHQPSSLHQVTTYSLQISAR